MRDRVMGGVVALVIALAIWNFIYTVKQQNRLDAWTQQCVAAGGLTSRVRASFSTETYECFKAGKVVNLPGWN